MGGEAAGNGLWNLHRPKGNDQHVAIGGLGGVDGRDGGNAMHDPSILHQRGIEWLGQGKAA